jgi:hypothetical protein
MTHTHLRIISRVILTLCCAALPAACGGDTATPTEPVTPPLGPPVVTAISPASGIGSGILFINGSNFGAASVVKVGGQIARVAARTATTLSVDLCNATHTDCEPAGALGAGGYFDVTVTNGATTATAPTKYFVYSSATYLAGDWETTLPTASAGIVSRFDPAANVVVLQAVPGGAGGFTVGDTVNRNVTRTTPYSWSAQGLLINPITSERLYTPVTIEATNVDELTLRFTLGGTSQRKRKVRVQ